MSRGVSTTNGHVKELSREESWQMFDRQAQRYLGVSGEEFVRAWDAGEYGDPDDRSKNPPEVMYLAMLLPSIR